LDMMMIKRTLLAAVLSTSCVTAALALEPRRGPLSVRRASSLTTTLQSHPKKACHSRGQSLLASVSPGGGSSDTDGKELKTSWKKQSASVLGYLVTAGACITKLPQIKRILVAGSADGISLTSNYLETISLTNKLLYHKLNDLPVSTWLENVALIAQQAVIIGLIWKLAVPATSAVHIAAALGVQIAYCVGALSLPKKAWPLLLVFKTVATLLSGGSQIRLNFMNQSCGQLAWSPVLLRIFGNCSRMITTLVLAKKDLALLSLYSTSALIQIVLGVQFWIYR